MKHRSIYAVVFLTFCLFCLNSLAQYSEPEVKDEKVFSSNEDIGSSSIISTPDNGLILGGSKGNGLCIIKMNSKLEKIWEKKYYSEYGGYVSSILLTNDNSIIFTGNNWTPTRNNIIIKKLNTNGVLIWEKQFKIDGSAESIIATQDNGFLVTGTVDNRIRDFDMREPNILVMKLDSRGNILWKIMVVPEVVGFSSIHSPQC